MSTDSDLSFFDTLHKGIITVPWACDLHVLSCFVGCGSTLCPYVSLQCDHSFISLSIHAIYKVYIFMNSFLLLYLRRSGWWVEGGGEPAGMYMDERESMMVGG